MTEVVSDKETRRGGDKETRWFALLLVSLSPPLLVFLLTAVSLAQEPQIELRYPYGPDSFRQEGVPRGTVTERVWKDSKIFPGTIRRYYVYVPAQYDASKPAALMVFQDGHAYIAEDGDFRVPVVFDNLIHKGEMPVTIGVFVDPGHKNTELPLKPGWQPQPENRAFEYDSLTPDYAEFLLTEILPAALKILPEGLEDYNVTDDPEGRAICGISSGGICAFTVAWQRPDQFHKVLSHVGSFVNIRGGDVYPGKIRKEDKRPLRVFLQGGTNDLDNEHGNWPLANQQMFAALKYRDYDVNFVYGQGGHNGNHGGAALPDSLRWLWRGYELPESKKTADSGWSKSDGDLGAMLFLTSKPDELFVAWEKPTLGVQLHETKSTRRGVPVVAVVVFSGCETDEKGMCQLSAEFAVDQPDGKLYDEPTDGELWIDKPPPPKGQLQLGVGHMGVIFESEDRPGTYRIRAKIVDKVANKTLYLERDLQLIADNGP